MLLKYFYDPALAHASYMVGCQRAKVAVIVDPGRDIEQYFDAADREGLTLAAVAETHIHADYVSGARELADRVGAKLYLSDEGPAEWKYQYASQYDSELVKNGSSFHIGNIRFDVLHTPGHTPESISFMLSDEGGGADKPMGIFTGDFVFVGSIGRPDLLEKAAGVRRSAEKGAHQLYHSAERFKQLPDYLQIWPAHGAGSACGKGLGAIPSSTVGYEKLFNPALQYGDEEEFVRYILADQPEAPKYFAVMKRVNKEGPTILGKVKLPDTLDPEQITTIDSRATLLDVSPSDQFAEHHVPGSLNIPVHVLASWAGWVVDYSRPVYLIAEQAQIPETMRVLRKIGLDQVQGVFSPSALRAKGLADEQYESATPEELASQIETGAVQVMDVRSEAEWSTGRIPEACHRFLGKLPEAVQSISRDRPIVTQCRSGARSAIAASILQAGGLNVINMTGGLGAWQSANLPISTPDPESGLECQDQRGVTCQA